MKFNIATSWISGSSELNRDVMARVGYPLTAMEFGIGRDAQGRVRATSPQVRSFEDFVRLAIAELLSPECRVRVRVCVSRTCERLFVLRPSEGQPPKGCPGTRHADAERLRKRRDREKDLDVKAKHIAQASLGKGKRRRK